MKFILTLISNLNTREKFFFYLITLSIFFLIILELLSLSTFFPIIQIVLSGKPIFLSKEDFFFNKLEVNFQLYYLLIFLVLLYFFKNIFYLYLTYIKKKFLSDIQINFSSRIFTSYLRQDYEFFLNNQKPQIIRNLGLLAEYIATLENFINIVIEILILGIVFFLIFYNSFLTGVYVVFLSITFIFLFLKIFKNRLKKYGELINLYNEKILNNYLDSLGSIKDIILRKKHNYFAENFYKNISSQANTLIKSGMLTELPRILIEIILITGLSSLIFLLITSSQDFKDTFIKLSFIIALILRAVPSVTRIVYQGSGLYSKVDTLKRVNALIEELKHLRPEKIKPEQLVFNNIILKNVSYNYSSNAKNIIFRNFNLNIKKNEAIGILGRSGAGKSTLLDIICGILYPTEGGIFLDDRLLSKDLISSWYNNISYISQKNYLLNASIAQNIAFAEDQEKIDENLVCESIKFSRLTEFVAKLKNGINTNIGEDGKNISGGQRQRIFIARAIYQNSSIIILDEATTGLDKVMEEDIMNDIKNNFYGKKTLIISTHNEKNLVFCNKIIKLK